jgi:hypothetical protein
MAVAGARDIDGGKSMAGQSSKRECRMSSIIHGLVNSGTMNDDDDSISLFFGDGMRFKLVTGVYTGEASVVFRLLVTGVNLCCNVLR